MSAPALAKYVAVFRINMLQQFAYTGETIARSLAMILFMVIFMGLWTTAYTVSGRSQLAGFTLPAIIWYLAMTETLMLARARAHIQIGEEVKAGDIVYGLNKPYHYPLFQWANALAASLVRFVVNCLIGIGVVLALTQTIGGSIEGLLGFMVLALAALVLDAGISVLIGLCAFVIEEVRPVDWIYQKLVFTLGGMFLPLDAFPDWLQTLSNALPFKYLVYAPARTFVRFDLDFFISALIGTLIYIVIVGVVMAALYAYGARRLSVNGG
jgi:ABC-2 type transport system permease protein